MGIASLAARLWRTKISCALFLALNLFAPVVAVGQTASVGRTTQVKWQHVKLVNGSPVLFQVTAPTKVQSVSASWLGHDVVFFRPAAGKTWYALAAVPVETAQGRYDLIVK